MAYTAPTTRSDGYVVPASVYNADIINNIISLRTGGAGAVLQTTTATGAQADFDLTDRWTYLRCTGAAPAFSGFTVAGSAPTAGDMVLIECLGTTAQVTTQGAGSTAENRAICASTIGQIVGLNGLMLGEYDGTTARWRVKVIDPGSPISVTFSAGNFTASGSQTWTVAAGDQKTFAYQQRGKMLQVWLRVQTSTVGGTPSTQLLAAVPGGFTITKGVTVPVVIQDNGTAAVGQCVLTATGTTMAFFLINAGNWAAATDTTNVDVCVAFEVD